MKKYINESGKLMLIIKKHLKRSYFYEKLIIRLLGLIYLDILLWIFYGVLYLIKIVSFERQAIIVLFSLLIFTIITFLFLSSKEKKHTQLYLSNLIIFNQKYPQYEERAAILIDRVNLKYAPRKKYGKNRRNFKKR